jgi:NifB/MoaA-like Fe-S oxidoreductase
MQKEEVKLNRLGKKCKECYADKLCDTCKQSVKMTQTKSKTLRIVVKKPERVVELPNGSKKVVPAREIKTGVRAKQTKIFGDVMDVMMPRQVLKRHWVRSGK